MSRIGSELDELRHVTEDRLASALVAACREAVIVADAAGRIVLWNDASEELFGHQRADVFGRSLDIIIPAAMRGEHSNGMRRLAEGGAPRLIGRPVEVMAQHADKSLLPVEMRISMWREDGALMFGAMIRDISDRRRAEERLHSLAHFDQLTLLPNRVLFLQRLQAALGEAAAPRDAAILLADIDNFGELNDRFGYAAGDEVLRTVAVALKRIASDAPYADATTARVGPNQFALLLPGCGDAFAALDVGQRVREALHELADDAEAPVLASVGVAIAPQHGRTSGQLLANADFALRLAKQDGGDKRQLFQANQRDADRMRRKLNVELKRAWDQGEFELHFQPQVRLSDREIVGGEALLRWNHPDKGLLLPGSFVKALAETRLAELVGDFVLRAACRQAARWRAMTGRPFRIGVNLFERQLVRRDNKSRVEAALTESGLPPEDLELELIETIVTGADETSIRRIRRLRELGVGIAFDDYGTGYASLALLKRYPITRLKIDRGFVRDMARGGQDAAIVEMLLTLGRAFGLDVIAEGVETHAQAALLRELGCTEAQGYLFGRPVAADVFEAMLLAPVKPVPQVA